ncbi:MAG: hypothetical protein ACJASM_000361 [Salibacteraceae bacterium]|jgi:hypothetical protein
MHFKNWFTLLTAIFLFNLGKSQVKDTVTIMHYNLLYYGETTTFCTVNNNNVNDKDTYLKRIVNHVQPDIFTINEMGCDATYAKRIRDLVLNSSSIEYESTVLQKSGSQNICNMLFYKTTKVKVVKQEKITTAGNGTSIVRAVDLYELQFLATNLSPNHTQLDTPSTHLLTMHLKASSSSANKGERELAAEGIMKHLEANEQPGNYLLSGDLNLYTNTEGAFQHFTDWTAPSYNFKDPSNRIGSWGNNSSFADMHTQSTHTSGGCHSTGGMDDRFDFILASQYIMTGRGSIQYITGTYKAIGQDGRRFNGRLDTPQNNSAPAAVIDALYNMSDHLPVVMQVEVLFGQKNNSTAPTDSTNSVNTNNSIPIMKLWINSNREIQIDGISKSDEYQIVAYNSVGSRIRVLSQHATSLSHISTVNLGSGLHIIRVENTLTGEVSNFKIVLP